MNNDLLPNHDRMLMDVYDRLLPESQPECPSCLESPELCQVCSFCAVCHDDSCTEPEFIEDRCSVSEEERCNKPATRYVRESFDPLGFTVRCCVECAEMLISSGYKAEVK